LYCFIIFLPVFIVKKNDGLSKYPQNGLYPRARDLFASADALFTFNPLTPTVVIMGRRTAIKPCQTGLSRHL